MNSYRIKNSTEGGRGEGFEIYIYILYFFKNLLQRLGFWFGLVWVFTKGHFWVLETELLAFPLFVEIILAKDKEGLNLTSLEVL